MKSEVAVGVKRNMPVLLLALIPASLFFLLLLASINLRPPRLVLQHQLGCIWISDGANRLTQSSGSENALNAAILLWGVVFGSIGFGFFLYGKKQGAIAPLVCGLTLMVFPYFISSTILLIAIGTVLMVIPYFVRR